MGNEIFGFVGGFNGSGLITIAIWFFVFLLIGGCVFAIILMVLIKKNQKKIIEINMQNKRLRIFSGRMRKRGKGVTQFWSRKIKRYLPDFQQKSVYIKGKQDTMILLKDNNGMYHSARIPTHKQIKKWYKIIYDIDIDDTKYKSLQKIRDIYLLPSPHEDLDWLSSQCVEAETEFKADHWWQSPTVAYVATGFICFMMIVVTMILEKKL